MDTLREDLRFTLRKRYSTYADYVDYSDPRIFSGLAAYCAWELSLATEGASHLLTGELVSANYFDLLGVHPEPGRGLSASSPEAPRAIACWLPARRAAAVDPTVALRQQ